jgi:hypothetical protein
MKKHKLLIIVLFVMVSILVMGASAEASDVVPLVIKNYSSDYVTLRLDGPRFYYLYVRPGETKTYTIERGEYAQQYYNCGAFVNSGLDLTKKNTIIVPACGSKALKNAGGNTTKVDGGRIIKLVKVSFKNEGDQTMILIFDGSGSYVFTLKPGETKTYTITKGPYNITRIGCQYTRVYNFYAIHNKVKSFDCEIH